MKKTLLTLLLLSSSLLAFAQGSWSARASLPHDTNAMYQGIPGFSIGNFGYAGLGEHDIPYLILDDIWQFDPSTNSWAKKAPFPGKARVGLACFVICDKAYLVTGSIYNAGTCVTECWEYDATNNIWTQKANFPGSERTYAVGFAINGKGYVGTGANELSDFRKDFYSYNPTTDTWTRIADFGGIARSGACGFSVNNKGYVCFGQDSTIKYYTDMWEYDPVTNSWTQKSNYPAEGILSANGFTICNNIYVGSGDSTGVAMDHRFWKYNTTTGLWSEEASIPGITTLQGAAFSINDTGYYGFGLDSALHILNKFNKFFAGDNCDNYDSCYQYLGVNNISNHLAIDIFPNPVNQNLHISFNKQLIGPATLSIMDITGRIVINSQWSVVSGQWSVDVSTLSSGMYFINLKNQDLFVTQKFIKQ